MLIVCEVINGGTIQIKKALSLLDKEQMYDSEKNICSAKDINDINNAFNLGVNIMSSVIHNETNVKEIKDIVGDDTKNKVKIFARIESKEAIINFDSILDNCDGIIIQLGLTTSDLKFDELKLVEQYMIARCRMQNKPVLLETNVLKSINVNKPLISKISAVDSSVKEGIDAIIVNDDTIIGNNYLATLKAFQNVLLQLEAYEDNKCRYEEMSR